VNRRVLMALGAILVLSIGVAAACSSDGDSALEDRLGALEQQVAALDQATQRSAMVAALHVLDAGGRLHEIDMAVHERGEVEAGSSGYVDAALLAIASTTWPDELRPQADDLRTKLQQFATALDGGDVAVVAPASRAAHDAAHTLTIDCSEHLAETVGLGEPQDGSEHDMEPPTAGSTPGHMDAGG